MARAPVSIGFGLPFEEAIAAAQARDVVLPAEFYGRAAGEARRAAFTVSGLVALDQVQAVRASLDAALASGGSFGDWQRQALERDWELPRGHIETVFRTNIQTAYSAGHWRSFREHQARLPYLMWSAINDSRVRPTHLEMDGHIAPVGDPIWDVWHPPAGYNCRCEQIALTAAQAEARGYGRQRRPAAQPDPGFGNAKPGDTEGAVAAARQRRTAKSAPALQRALATREAAQVAVPVPTGRPVSKAFALRGKSEASTEFRAAIEIIDRLHGDGALPVIPMRVSSGSRVVGGYGLDGFIRVSKNGDHMRLTAAHEIGHFLDHRGWGNIERMSSGSEAAAKAWRDAVNASPSIQRLRELASSSGGQYVRYLLSVPEIWARSYSQWVATRSKDPVMLSQVAKIRAHRTEAGRLAHWGVDEFEPIAKAIDDLFMLLGWRKP